MVVEVMGAANCTRAGGRRPEEIRPLRFRRRYTRQAPGSVLVRLGKTTVLCTCCIEPEVPRFLVGSGRGWITAEYGMLPGSTGTRKARDRGGKVDGRSVEIQRLIGRSSAPSSIWKTWVSAPSGLTAMSWRRTAARARRPLTAATSPWWMHSSPTRTPSARRVELFATAWPRSASGYVATRSCSISITRKTRTPTLI